MDDFKKRLYLESDELSTKIEKLALFIDSEFYKELPGTDRELLYKQLIVMREYNNILQTRIDNYNNKG